MIIYNVTLNVKKEIESEWVRWMKEKHIPDIIKTNHFNSWKMLKILVPGGMPDETTYVVSYTTDSMEKYEEYARNEAPRLQMEHVEKYLGKFTASRAILEDVT
jgi:hypothetical protein